MNYCVTSESLMICHETFFKYHLLEKKLGMKVSFTGDKIHCINP